MVDPMDSQEVKSEEEEDSVSFIVNKNGVTELLVDGYTFSCYHVGDTGEKNWGCTNSHCRAKVYTIDDDKIVSTSSLTHNHEPPFINIKEEPQDDDEEYDEDDHSYYQCDSTEISRICNAIDSSSVPSFTSFVGEYNFELVLPQNGRYKSSWEFSNVFNQIFIDINKVLMVQFVLDAPPSGTELFIRAMPVYCNTDFIGIPVNRCTLHSVEDDPNNEAHTSDDRCFCSNYNHVGHVVKSQSAGAIFSYDRRSKRHSVSVPVAARHRGRNSLDILYTFTCKTSCQKGMQRRPINLVFTLENKTGEVLGRSALAVKICSCPKRDRDRLERDYANKKIRLSPTRIVSLSHESRPVTDGDMLKSKIRDELKNMYKAKFMFERSLRALEGLLDEL